MLPSNQSWNGTKPAQSGTFPAGSLTASMLTRGKRHRSGASSDVNPRIPGNRMCKLPYLADVVARIPDGETKGAFALLPCSDNCRPLALAPQIITGGASCQDRTHATAGIDCSRSANDCLRQFIDHFLPRLLRIVGACYSTPSRRRKATELLLSACSGTRTAGGTSGFSDTSAGLRP
jgi:hypothetical protein